MDSKLKERLVGATVLVALGVLLIPWLLDGRDEPVRVDEDSADRTISLPVPAAEPAETARSASRSDDQDDVSGATGPSEPSGNGTGAAGTARSGQTDRSAVESADSEAEERAASADAVADPATGPTARVPVPAPASASSSASAAVAEGSAPDPGDPAWVVQVGSFRDQANATKLVSQVADYGFDARVTEYSSSNGVLHRVRVGRYATRTEAETVMSSLAAHGLSGSVLREE